MQNERVAASGKNMRTALVGQLFTTAVNLVLRRIFLNMLGSEYMGFNGLCAHFLNFLSLLEPGFAAACVFSLYKPLAYKDTVAAAQICKYLKKIYRTVAALSFVSGLLMSPLVLKLCSEDIGRSYALAVWLLLLVEMCTAYLFCHRRILPSADQKVYILSIYGYAFFVISGAARLAALVVCKSFIAYLCVGILCNTAEELLVYMKIRSMYPFLEEKVAPLPTSEKTAVIRRVRSLFLQKTGAILCGSVDNMAVFAFLGLTGGAMYSNYTMLSGICLTFITAVTGAAAASVGNLGVTQSAERIKRVYLTAFFAVFFAAGVFAVTLFFIYPTVVGLWMGKSMVLGTPETALFCVSMFVSAIRKPTAVFIDALGLFEYEKYKSITEAAIGCAVTLLLAPRFGICGVLLGQIAGMTAFPLWFEPYILFRYGFRCGMSGFFASVVRYLAALFASATLAYMLCDIFGSFSHGIAVLLCRSVLCFVCCACVFAAVFFDSRPFRDSLFYGVRLLKR